MANPVMEERHDPRQISFSTGDVVEGILAGVERRTVKEKLGIRYSVLQNDGVLVCFWGTYQLNEKLRPADRGHYVSIRCEGEDTMVKRGDNCMKVFKVLVSKELAKDGELYITDGDIPF